MSEDITYTTLNLIESFDFLSSSLGKEMMDGIIYHTQGYAEGHSIKVMRCSADTIICIGVLEYSFRHWLSGVAGMTVREVGKAAIRDVYARMGDQWVNL